MEGDQYSKYHDLKFERLKPVLEEQYKQLVTCIERETREKLRISNIQFDVPAEYFSYLNEDAVRKKKEKIEENMKQTEVRTFFQRKVFKLITRAVNSKNFDQ